MGGLKKLVLISAKQCRSGSNRIGELANQCEDKQAKWKASFFHLPFSWVTEGDLRGSDLHPLQGDNLSILPVFPWVHRELSRRLQRWPFFLSCCWLYYSLFSFPRDLKNSGTIKREPHLYFYLVFTTRILVWWEQIKNWLQFGRGALLNRLRLSVSSHRVLYSWNSSHKHTCLHVFLYYSRNWTFKKKRKSVIVGYSLPARELVINMPSNTGIPSCMY